MMKDATAGPVSRLAAFTTNDPIQGASGSQQSAPAAMDGHDVQVSLQHVSRAFGGVRAVEDVSIDVERRAFLAILGPSGCGKTTLLRIVGGLERPDSGRVVIDGVDVTDAPPNKRPTNLVFQHGALFPHMTVAENIGYGLRRKGWSGSRTATRVEEMLTLVQLDGYADRRPSQLSGGQARRVGLARALAPSPDVLLLDEPLSALDLKLRKEMQLQLRRIHREVGTTFVYVTHDQEEALVMADRIIVMRSGRIAQDASPRRLYASPASVFVASFIGEANLFRITLPPGTDQDPWALLASGERVRVAPRPPDHTGDSHEAVLSIRPELVHVGPDRGVTDRVNEFEGEIEESIYLGDRVRIRVRTGGGWSIWALVPFDSPVARLGVGDQTLLWWAAEDARLLPWTPDGDELAGRPVE